MNAGSVPVTVLLAVKNEAANITKCLESLAPATHVLVVDSHSSDSTAELAAKLGAEVIQFDYQGRYPKKRQWALENAPIKTDWVLLLDADEVVPPKLWEEILAAIEGGGAENGFLIQKGFHFLGRRFRFGGFSHWAVLLLRHGKGKFEQTAVSSASYLDMEVHERIIVDGAVGKLSTPLIHEDFKGLHAYVDRHNKYSTWEAELRYKFLTTGRYGDEAIRPKLFGDAQERRRFLKYLAVRLPGEPWLWFAYHFVFKLGFLHGRPGLIAAQIRANYIRETRSKVYELSCRDKGRKDLEG